MSRCGVTTHYFFQQSHRADAGDAAVTEGIFQSLITAFNEDRDMITAQSKAAVLESGYTIGVPAFIKEGDGIKIDTRTGNYVERITVKK